VLLDFDLAQSLDEVGVQEDESGTVSGTLAYMAPEQLWGMPLGPASDVYAMGVVFHEALTGALPFGGEPPLSTDPGARVELSEPPWSAALPEDLRELVSELLDPDPARRPGLDEVLDRLGADSRAGDRVSSARLARESAGFVGRGAERSRLIGVASDRGSTRVIGIHGASGIGKSELVRNALGELEAGGETVVLRGRCHPEEAVPFKALDPVVDALASYLLAIEPDARRELTPEHGSSLGRLFPVLERVPELVSGPLSGETDAVEVRRRGVGALRDLLGSIAQRVSLVVWIDDAQWSDADSAGLLADLLAPPLAPALCLVLSYRRADREDVELRRIAADLSREFRAFRFEEIAIEPLGPADCAALARQMLAPGSVEDEVLQSLASECGGSPFFLAELLWDWQTRGVRSDSPRGLEDVIGARIDGLAPEDLRILELLALCGRPAERSLVLEAADLGERGRPVVQRLEGVGLVRTTGADGRRCVETYHDRIRETVTSRLEAEARRRRHRDLALVFEASGRAEPDQLAHHFHGAGQLPRAARYALVAADRAEGALAFLQAAEFVRRALEWDPPEPGRRRQLIAREADARVRAAHLVDGGRLYQEAARGAPALHGLELRRRAAEHLVSGGAVDEGIDALRRLLRDLGLRYPGSPRRALLGSLVQLVRVVTGGHAARAARAAARAAGGTEVPIEPLERIRIDTCFAAGKTLVDADSVRGIYFSLESLVRALRVGEPWRLAQSLSVVGGSIAVVGEGPLARLGHRMMDGARSIVDAIDSPELRGTFEVARGQVLMLAGRCPEALVCTEEGVRRLSEQCQGKALECNIGRATALRALEDVGRMADLQVRAQELRDAAAAAGNRYAETAGVQSLAIARLAAGDVGGARELARHGLRLWTRSGFHIQHLYAARIEALCDLYEGDPEAGERRIAEIEPDLRRSGLLRVPLARIDVSSLQAQLFLASARTGADGSARRLRAAARTARRLERLDRADAAVHAALIRAGAEGLARETGRAVHHLGQAADAASRCGQTLRAAAARWRAATLESRPGDREAAIRIAKDCGVGDPERWFDLLTPGFGSAASVRLPGAA
jgi:hypothetical protein